MIDRHFTTVTFNEYKDCSWKQETVLLSLGNLLQMKCFLLGYWGDTIELILCIVSIGNFKLAPLCLILIFRSNSSVVAMIPVGSIYHFSPAVLKRAHYSI